MGRVRYKIIWDQMSARWAELGTSLIVSTDLLRLYVISNILKEVKENHFPMQFPVFDDLNS